MSADNFIAIIKEDDGSFTAYDCCASKEVEGYYIDNKRYREGTKLFKAKDVEEAIMKVQNEYSEYGYEFINL